MLFALYAFPFSFIVIRVGTFNFSLRECIVWYMVVFVPCGVENSTPSQHSEKYYSRRLWDAMSLSIRSASMWSHGFFIVLVVSNIAHLQWAPQQDSMFSQSFHPFEKVCAFGCACVYKDRSSGLVENQEGVDSENGGKEGSIDKCRAEKQGEKRNMKGCIEVCVSGSLHWCILLCTSAGGHKEATDVSAQLLLTASFQPVMELS